MEDVGSVWNRRRNLFENSIKSFISDMNKTRLPTPALISKSNPLLGILSVTAVPRFINNLLTINKIICTRFVESPKAPSCLYLCKSVTLKRYFSGFYSNLTKLINRLWGCNSNHIIPVWACQIIKLNCKVQVIWKNVNTCLRSFLWSINMNLLGISIFLFSIVPPLLCLKGTIWDSIPPPPLPV